MLSKKLSEVLKVWESSNKDISDLQKEYNLKNVEVSKLREQIKNSDSMKNRLEFLRGER